ncbi:MAG: hydroxymethylglutaryl-CoA synthase [Calditrichaeota bacterium]|jgi:hydroxymethylglutaryl-CoA synthase|nr:hydroxymethylglutaryl-CoA synthase [Calditrichota bacterium]MBT7616678.1 hydroxymethylglutaryl-CoA synthase [Calditrichota bacterium]MBT7788846.1 hydroxymethylglutaryl-CoA synthase [Calditrichota bacterium]
MQDVGIVGYGAYIPRYRIKVESIASVWGNDPENYKRGLQLREKSVPGHDQDTITLSVEAARYALKRAGVNPERLGCVYVGSESHPYAVKPTGTILSEAIGATPECHTADFEFACKAGTEAMYVCYAQVKAGLVEIGLGIGADTSQGAPGDALEYSASAGAAAYIFGTENILARVDETYAYMTDTPDFWRREHQHYPQHAGRFTGDPAYFKHTLGAAKGIMKKTGMTPEDFDYAVFHQPNGKFPMAAGKKLGFPREKIETGWLVPWLGNTYSGASPLGLSAVLDVAEPGNKILMVSFGSGAGSDAFVFTVQDPILKVRDLAPKTRPQLDENKIYLDYGRYAKFRGKILRNS